MTQNNFILDMYRTIDANNTNGLVNLMTEDSVFRYANVPALEGKANITAFLNGFFQSIKAIRHTEIECWNTGGVWFATGNVNYTRHNDSLLKVPFSVLLKMNGDLIREFLVFVDTSELYK